MDRYSQLSPCAASALFGTRQIIVAGKQVGVSGLDTAFAAVEAKNIVGDAEVTAALISYVRRDNYIPPGLENEYATAVLAEYHRITLKK